MRQIVPIKQKYIISIQEASEYFGIGSKNMRRLAEDGLGTFSFHLGGVKYLIIREKAEEFFVEYMKKQRKIIDNE